MLEETMKKLLAILTLLLCLQGLSASAQKENESKIIPLRYADAQTVAQHIREGTPTPEKAEPDKRAPQPPADIPSVAVDARTNSLIMTGSPAALARAQQVIRTLDVPSIQVRLDIRVLRLIHESSGDLTIETVGTPRILTLNRLPAKLSIGAGKEGYTFEIYPQVNGDGSILLAATMSAALAERMQAGCMRIVEDGETTMLLGVTDSADPDTRRAVQSGKLSVVGTEKHTDYYLQVTPTEVIRHDRSSNMPLLN
jgi:hypothetical protein